MPRRVTPLSIVMLYPPIPQLISVGKHVHVRRLEPGDHMVAERHRMRVEIRLATAAGCGRRRPCPASRRARTGRGIRPPSRAPRQPVRSARRSASGASGRCGRRSAPWPAAAGTLLSVARSRCRPAWPARRRRSTLHSMTLWPPMKRATNGVFGLSNTARGASLCRIWPRSITTTRSASAIASSCACVTWMKVMPSSRCRRFSSSRILPRRNGSSADSGSSSSSTAGW